MDLGWGLALGTPLLSDPQKLGGRQITEGWRPYALEDRPQLICDETETEGLH